MRFAHVKFVTKRKYGFELEFTSKVSRERIAEVIATVPGERADVVGYEHSYNNPTWKCKTDSSCGYEVASRVLSGSDDLEKAKKVVQAIKDSGVRVNESCGFHVHVNVKDLTQKEFGSLVSYWVKMEGFISNSVPPSRKRNNYCQLVFRNFSSKTKYSGDDVINRIMRCGKYASLNLQNYSEKRTIEFRIAEGTCDANTVYMWVAFLLWFVEMTSKLPLPENLDWYFPDEVLQVLNLANDPKNEEFKIYSPILIEMKRWIISRIIEQADNEEDQRLAEHIREEI